MPTLQQECLKGISIAEMVEDFINSDNQTLFKRQLIEDLESKLLQERQNTIEEILELIDTYIPKDDMGDYGGTGAMSYEEICEMFLEDMIPAIKSLDKNKKGKE